MRIAVIGTGELARAGDVLALAGALKVSPLYLAGGWEDTPAPGQRPTPAVPFPARTDPRTLARHHHLARHYATLPTTPTATFHANGSL